MNRSASPASIPSSAPDAPPWGAFRPGPLARAALAASQAVPNRPLIKQLSFLFRRVVRLLGDDELDVEHWGLRLRLRPRGNISEGKFLFMPDRWDRTERALLARELHPGDRFVDVGANAGGYLWWVQRVLGSDWRGLAIEPDPQLDGRLRFNLATNGMAHVDVVAAAVSPAAGTGRGTLRRDPKNRGENVLVTEAAATDDLVDVRVVPLPELVEEAGMDRVDVLKIDVEGLEPAILDDFLDRAPDRLLPRLIMTEVRDSPEHRATLDRLAGLGYREAARTRLNAILIQDR